MLISKLSGNDVSDIQEIDTHIIPQEMYANGYRAHIETEPPELTAEDYENQMMYCVGGFYHDTDTDSHRIKFDKVINASEVRYLIKLNQQQLTASDYKIIKMLEYSLTPSLMDDSGETAPPPYDMEELHAERQQLRDRINFLRNKLNQ